MTAPTIDPTLPETVQAFLRGGAKLETIHLDAGGTWTHEGMAFENKRLIALFSRSVGRTPGGTWVLNVGQFTYPIEVEDTGFFVERIDLSAPMPLLTLSDGSVEELDPESIVYRAGGRLYCTVKGGEFRARFKRGPYHSLMERIEQDGEDVVLRLPGHAVTLAKVGELED